MLKCFSLTLADPIFAPGRCDSELGERDNGVGGERT